MQRMKQFSNFQVHKNIGITRKLLYDSNTVRTYCIFCVTLLKKVNGPLFVGNGPLSIFSSIRMNRSRTYPAVRLMPLTFPHTQSRLLVLPLTSLPFLPMLDGLRLLSPPSHFFLHINPTRQNTFHFD